MLYRKKNDLCTSLIIKYEYVYRILLIQGKHKRCLSVGLMHTYLRILMIVKK
jgi:hypothetical protein